MAPKDLEKVSHNPSWENLGRLKPQRGCEEALGLSEPAREWAWSGSFPEGTQDVFLKPPVLLGHRHTDIWQRASGLPLPGHQSPPPPTAPSALLYSCHPTQEVQV